MWSVFVCLSCSFSMQGAGSSGHVWDERPPPAPSPARAANTTAGAAGQQTQLQCHPVGQTHRRGVFTHL